MRVIFGILPPLPVTAVWFIHKRMLPNQHMRILGGIEIIPDFITQEEQDQARASVLGAIAPLYEECDEKDDPELVADMEDEKPESLEICLRNPSRYLKPGARLSCLGVGLEDNWQR